MPAGGKICHCDATIHLFFVNIGAYSGAVGVKRSPVEMLTAQKWWRYWCGGAGIVARSQSQVTDGFNPPVLSGHRARMANKYVVYQLMRVALLSSQNQLQNRVYAVRAGEAQIAIFTGCYCTAGFKDIEQANERLRQQEASAKPMDSVLAKRSDTQAAIDVLAKTKRTAFNVQPSEPSATKQCSQAQGRKHDSPARACQPSKRPAPTSSSAMKIVMSQHASWRAEDVTNGGMLALPALVLEGTANSKRYLIALLQVTIKNSAERTCPELGPLAEPPQPALWRTALS